jgi:hypothetical protein
VLASVAAEYVETIDRIRYGRFSNEQELRHLEGQRALLHQQLIELLGHEPTLEEARALVLQSRARGER